MFPLLVSERQHLNICDLAMPRTKFITYRYYQRFIS